MTRFLSIDSEERSASKLIQIIGCIQFLEVEELRSLAPGLLVGSWLGNVLFSMFCFPGPCIRPSRNTNRKLDTFGEDFFFSFWLLCRAKANTVLPREHTGHGIYPLPTTQEKTLPMDITRWSTPKSDWLYSLQPKMEKLYTVNKNKTGSWLWLRSWTPYCQIQA